MKIFQSAGGVVVGADNKIVVVNQNNDSWSLPKGHIEEGETSLEAARREIKEECGISELEFITELGQYQRPRIGLHGKGDDTEEIKRITIFLFKTSQKHLQPQDKNNPFAEWADMNEVTEKLTHKKDKEFFESVKSDILKHLDS